MDQTTFVRQVDRVAAFAEGQGLTTLKQLREQLQGGQLAFPPTAGGHTPCSEVITDEGSFYVDFGTGLRVAGARDMGEGRKEFNFFVTHLHWDHLMGLPFFVPIFVPGCKLNIHYVHAQADDNIRNLFNGVNFPLKWDQLGADVAFHKIKIYQETQFGDVKVTPFALDHPGGCFGYRFDHKGKSICIGVDGEYKRLTPKDLGKDHRFYQNLDLLLFDAQYEMAELVDKHDWGHCTPTIGIDLALREKIRNLVFIHHDPSSTDERLHATFLKSQDYLKKKFPAYADQWQGMNQDGPNLIFGYDGLEVSV